MFVTAQLAVKGGYFLKDVALFDSAFYNYTTDVASVRIDPTFTSKPNSARCEVCMLMFSVSEGNGSPDPPASRERVREHRRR